MEVNVERTSGYMTPQCAAIHKALKVFKCLHFDQIPYFMPSYETPRGNYPKAIANFLAHEKYAYMRDNCLYLRDLSSPDEMLIDTVWTVIDLFKDNERDIPTALRTAFKPPYPCVAGVIKDNDTKYMFLPIYSAMDFVKLDEENEHYKATKTDEKVVYILIMRNLDLVEEFNKKMPEFPFKIAHLEGEIYKKPTIKYYELNR